MKWINPCTTSFIKRLQGVFFMPRQDLSLHMFKSVYTFFLVFIALGGCEQNTKSMSHKYTNALIEETSPYLLQHAHNPVNWVAWSPEVLKRAKEENKLLLISIGYAACHWCHVMEKECFEDEEVARVMNTHFIPVKIDREERPDIDHIYMDAVQMMTGSGGWPLNVVALPDGRPFWGATYVQKPEWIRILGELSSLYESNPEKVLEYAKSLEEGIKAINLVPPKPETDLLPLDELGRIMANWSTYFDKKYGGYNRAPKFMMPVNLDYLLHYATARKDADLLEYVNTTLTKMAYGGVYDHLGGGFSRYSVDNKWHVPHFEKMLYDNGQLVSLYAKAYAATANELYRAVVVESISFVREELMDSSYGFYSSLDADSNNEAGHLEEGAYYVWKKEELEQLLGDKFTIFQDYYNINAYGLWESGNYVLIRDETDAEIAGKYSISTPELQTLLKAAKKTLLQARNKKEKPRLDDKVLASWNGLMLSGLVDAYRYLGDAEYLDLALKNAAFLKEHMIRKDGSMYHNYKNGSSTISGYLEDYASIAEAFQKLYEVTLDESWLRDSKALLDYCLVNFWDEDSKLFYFTSKQEDFIIRRTLETTDNVIPASNSIMANNLFKLSKYFPSEGYDEISRNMLNAIQENFYDNASNHANWLHLVLYRNQPFYEVVTVGEDYREKNRRIQQNYLPHAIFAGSAGESGLSLLEDRYVEDSTLIYVCQHGSCKLPVTDIQTVIIQLMEFRGA